MHEMEAEIASSDYQCTRHVHASQSAQATRAASIRDYREYRSGKLSSVYTQSASEYKSHADVELMDLC